MKQKKKRKIRFGRIFLALMFLAIIILGILKIINIRIKNIFIIDNNYLLDQEIIELAGIEDYPSTFKFTSSKIKNNLLESDYIKDVKVKKKGLTKVYIYIEENEPLFYSQSDNKTTLENGKKVDKLFNVPTLLNYVPDTIYDKFLKEMNNVNKDILLKISEIQYCPDDEGEPIFLLYMTDGNYVYLTLNKISPTSNISKFTLINNYIDIIKDEKFQNKKGILYLDSGNHFQILEN